MTDSAKDHEYREMFLAEALENFAEINRLLTVLEKNINDQRAIQALFRITHTLKGNATGLGFDKIADMAHVLEDFFCEVQEGRLLLGTDIFSSVFKAVDTLGELIDAIKTPREIKFRGVKTRLEILIRKARAHETADSVDVDEAETANISNSTSSHETADGPSAGDSDIGISFSDLVQVPVRKLDSLLNLVGELVIERDRIIASGLRSNSANEFSRLNRISSDLQYSVMDVRLVQVGFLFNKFHRIVRDIAHKENKTVRLRLEGTETEIDRNILHAISDSLIHLIRNAVGHGIEEPEARKKAGKPEEGTVTISANSESETVVIQIKDDGAGIDIQKIRKKAVEKGLISHADAGEMKERDLTKLIFEPGFSTMEQVTAIAGRGVGMDVVKKTLDSVGGSIQVDSMPADGTVFTLRLLSSMAVKSTLLFEVGNQTYAIPLSYTEAVISVYKQAIHKAGNALITVHLEKPIQILFLSDLFFINSGSSVANSSVFNGLHPEKKLEIVVVSFNGRRLGLIVDRLLQQKEIVEKPLRKPFDHISFLSGVTILGNGNVCLSLSIPGILNAVFSSQGHRTVNA